MALETNLNVSPYFDDYDEAKGYHRILFRPGVALQARELTQLQTMLQAQFERFGDNVFLQGTIIDGCHIYPDYGYNYIKIKDLQEDGQAVSLASYDGALLIQESYDLRATVIDSVTGLETQDPDLNTLYIKYLNTGSGGEKEFANNQVIKVFDPDRTIESITITAGGTLYSNSDTITISGNTGTGAIATITTNGDGKITDVSMVSKGSGYTTTPNVSITTATGGGAILAAVNYIAEIRVADSAYTAPVGRGSAIKVDRGIIYQKGNFIRVEPQTTILEKYSSVANNKSVGFYTSESIVNSNVDTTLLDIATGTPNFAAPGANRLKLDPVLVVVNTEIAVANNDFLPILEFQDGRIVRSRETTQFNSINKEMARRTFEESGDYVLNAFTMDTVPIDSNTTHFHLVMSPGTAYVQGERVSLLNNSRTSVRKGTDSANAVNQTINTKFGSYLTVQEMSGLFEIKNGTQVILRDTAGTDVTDNLGNTPTTPGSVIGTAYARSLEYSSGTIGTPSARYKLYLFNVVMSPGKSFRDVRSVTVNGTAIADVVLSNGRAELQDLINDTLVFPTGTFAVKELTAEEFVFRTSTTATLTTGGDVTITFSGANTIPYGTGALTDSDKEEFIIIPQSNLQYTSTLTGTLSANTTTNVVIGTATAFTTELDIGDYIVVGNSSVYSAPQRITNIANNTYLTLAANFSGLSGGTANAVSNTVSIGFPAYVPINMLKDSNRQIVVNSTTSLTVDLGAATNVATTFTMYHNLENYEPSVRAKTVNNPVYVKISTDSLANTTTGPWCLGIPDVFSIEGVYVGSSNSYSTSSTNYKDEFILLDGQKDNYYGLSFLSKKPGSGLALTSSSCLLVALKSFSHGSGKYLSTESYPVDDASTVLPSDKIRTETIPIYISSTSGEAISLRDAIDFRPIVVATANTAASTVGDATIDPPATEVFVSGEKFFPSPSVAFQTTIESYLSRIDRIVINRSGQIKALEGIPANFPVAPPSEMDSMSIGTINVAPYPTLTSKAASDAKRTDLKSYVSLEQTKRYTMKDISRIEDRIQRLEYYTLLNTIEAQTTNLTIPSESNTSIERFKNGFFVEPFNDYSISDINDGEYKALIDTGRSRLTAQQELIPIDLKYSSASGLSKVGDLVGLPYTSTPFVYQNRANKERTLVTGYWNYIGKMGVIPKVDNFFDTDVTSTSVIEVNIADPVSALTDSINDVLSQVNLTPNNFKSSWSDTFKTVDREKINQWQTKVTTNYSRTLTTTKTDTYAKITPSPTVTSTQEIGTFLKSVQVNPFIREQKICLFVTGLRPGAQHWLWFDGVSVVNYAVPATVASLTNAGIDDFKPSYAKGASPGLFASASGSIAIIVYLPGNTFTTGNKEFLLMDVSSLTSESSATSKATGKFSSFTTSGDSGTITQSTKTFDLSAGKDSFNSNTYSSTSVYSEFTSRWKESTIEGVIPPPPPPPPDPIAQSFYVNSQDGSEYVHLTAIDVWFKEKDANTGVTLDLREVSDDGYVKPYIIPFGTVYKAASEVSTSNNASTYTTFTFPSPVQIRTDRDYAFSLTPDGASPNYRVWTAVPGVPDVFDSTLSYNTSWGEGTLFYSTSGRAFTAVQDEDIKFRVHRAKFTGTSGTVTLTNSDTEYLTISNTTGSFTGGEDVAQIGTSYIGATLTTNTSTTIVGTNTNLSSTLSANDTVLFVYGTSSANGTGLVNTSGNTVVNATATNTGFTASYSAGDFIRIGDHVRQVVAIANDYSLTIDSSLPSSASSNSHCSVAEHFEVLRVISANSSTVTFNRPPAYNTSNTQNAVSIQKAVSGKVRYYNSSKGKLYLTDSNASNSNFKILASNSTYRGTIVGDNSEASAKVASIDNVTVSSFLPFISTLIMPGTTISGSMSVAKAAGGTATYSYPLTGRTKMDSADTLVVKSLSNEIAGITITKSMSTTLSLGTSYTSTSPVVDVNPATFVFSKYLIGNTVTGETKRYGNADCKYISKRLVLADGLDAEDIKVYLTAFKPSGTEIYVYAKILNQADPESFDDKDWTLLTQETSASLFSSSLDSNDLKEYTYTFPYAPPANTITGTATANTGNATIVGISTTFTSSITANSIVKLTRNNTNTDYFISPVSSVANNTSLTFENPVTFTGLSTGVAVGGLKVEVVNTPLAAFKYNQNSNVVRYYNKNQESMDSYKYMSLKIVLTSTNAGKLIPEVNDVRAIAVSI